VDALRTRTPVPGREKRGGDPAGAWPEHLPPTKSGRLLAIGSARIKFVLKGDTLKADECYFYTAPTFETKSEKYGWLNAIQAVGKMVEQKRGEGSFIEYDIFALK
jgi:hypothetical protein